MDYEEIPSDLRPIYKNIDNEVKWIHAKWKVYNQLFAVEQEQIDILNRTASLFFRIVQQTILQLQGFAHPAALSRDRDIARYHGHERKVGIDGYIGIGILNSL